MVPTFKQKTPVVVLSQTRVKNARLTGTRGSPYITDPARSPYNGERLPNRRAMLVYVRHESPYEAALTRPHPGLIRDLENNTDAYLRSVLSLDME